MPMPKHVMPAAVLEARPSDVNLRDEQFMALSLFAQLKRKASLDKYAGALMLGRFRKGEVICRQGEAGWTAFYVLASEDVLTLPEAQGKKGAAGDPRSEEHTSELQSHVNLVCRLLLEKKKQKIMTGLIIKKKKTRKMTDE